MFEDNIPDSPHWQFTFIYSPPIPSLKCQLCDDLNIIGNTFNGAWLMAGDFNAVFDQQDKTGGKLVATCSTDAFRNIIDTNDLIDLGYCGHSFTWNNKRVGKANIQERLDRGFANGAWKALFPTFSLTHLPAIKSDHRPILINTTPLNSRPKPFRFEAMWLRDSSLGSVIDQAWPKRPHPTTLSHLMSNIKTTKLALKCWNRAHFGNVHTKIQTLQNYIDQLQSQSQTRLVIKMEQIAQQELDELLLRESIHWKEKAKTKWLEEGDTNTRFFHLSIVLHRRNNHIHYILNEHNARISDPLLIGDAFTNFYTNIFASCRPLFPLDLLDLITPIITPSINAALTAVSNDLEISQAISNMANNKSPGPDGMGHVFYKTFWTIVGKDVIMATQDFFMHGKISKAANHTFIALIPKK